MEDLFKHKCIPCEQGGEKMSLSEIDDYLVKVPGWNLIEKDGSQALEKSYKFKNFIQALEFTGKVGQIAEQQWHHPTIITEWGNVTVTWTTHKIKGLHVNDFAMAAQTDQLLEQS